MESELRVLQRIEKSVLPSPMEEMTEETRKPTTPKQALRLIILPMPGTFGCMRTNLHLVHVRYLYPGWNSGASTVFLEF
jgi:hypothetical protein